MPTVGLDCQIILDGTGYFIEPTSYHMIRPRVRSASHTRLPAVSHGGAGERYLDLGPGKREWTFIAVCFQAMRTYAGNVVSQNGQQYRDALHTSYEKVNTPISFTDPAGTVWSVHFDDLQDSLTNVRAQVDAELQFFCHILLIEA